MRYCIISARAAVLPCPSKKLRRSSVRREPLCAVVREQTFHGHHGLIGEHINFSVVGSMDNARQALTSSVAEGILFRGNFLDGYNGAHARANHIVTTVVPGGRSIVEVAGHGGEGGWGG